MSDDDKPQVKPLTVFERRARCGRREVELQLGVRVVKLQSPTLYTNGVQIVFLRSDGSTRAVQPGEPWQLSMFDMLVEATEQKMFGSAGESEAGEKAEARTGD